MIQANRQVSAERGEAETERKRDMLDGYTKDHLEVEVDEDRITCDGLTFGNVILTYGTDGETDYDDEDGPVRMMLEYDSYDGADAGSYSNPSYCYRDGIYTRGYTPDAFDFFFEDDDEPFLTWHTDYDKTGYESEDDEARAMELSAELAWALCYCVENA